MSSLICIKSFSNSLIRTSPIGSSSQGLRRFSDAAASTSAVKELRNRTSAGYMDCKKALTESNGDIDKAVEWLRKKGMAKAASKADRSTAEGVIAVAHNPASPNLGLLLEMNSETDFVSRGTSFSELVSKVAQSSLQSLSKRPISEFESGKLLNTEELKNLPLVSSSGSVGDAIKETIGKLGENIQLRRAFAVGVPEGKGVVGSYAHRVQGTPANGVTLGGIGSLILLEMSNPDPNAKSAIGQLGNKLAQHVVGFNPQFVTRDQVTPDDWKIAKEAYLKRQEERKENPQNLSDKQYEDKFAPDLVLMEQEGVDGRKVSQMLSDVSKGGAKVTVKMFKKFIVGEGLEKKVDNFAEEVQKLAQAK